MTFVLKKEQIIAKALELEFEDIGFTTADPFDTYKEILLKRMPHYEWTLEQGIELEKGSDPHHTLPEAKSIIALVEPYFKKSFPSFMEGHFGRCYLDDDRVTKDGLELRIKAFRDYLRNDGIKSKASFSLPHRASAARAGLGTFGKNCFFYSRKVARGGSWVLPIILVIDREYTADDSTLKIDCPDWCRNACISACPTRALQGNGTINPEKCISYMTYHGDDITPIEMREPMGMYVYGCDRCQNVCPRNQPWLAQKLPENEKVVAKAQDFELSKLLHMDKPYFKKQIWPHMFYMGASRLWKWKMNVARVMGNSNDASYLPDLEKAYKENDDERLKGMVVWSMGKLGNKETVKTLEAWSKESSAPVKEEIQMALESLLQRI